jgi:hypothetical protein
VLGRNGAGGGLDGALVASERLRRCWQAIAVELHEDRTAVARVTPAPHPPLPFQTVEQNGRPARRELEAAGELARSERAVGLEVLERIQVRERDARCARQRRAQPVATSAVGPGSRSPPRPSEECGWPASIRLRSWSPSPAGACAGGSRPERRRWSRRRPNGCRFPTRASQPPWAVNVAHHWGDVREALAELARVLQPGGRLAVAVRRSGTTRTRLDPHRHGASADELDRLESLLAAAFTDLRRDERRAGRATLTTILARRRNHRDDRR